MEAIRFKTPEERMAERAERLAKIKALGEPPHCAYCNEPLRPCRFATDLTTGSDVWGYCGNGLFCTLRCGYNFGRAAHRAGYKIKQSPVSG